MHWGHSVAAPWDWLVVSGGFWKALVGWSVAFIFGFVVAHGPWKAHRAAQEDIRDKLDTETPGGLGAVKEAINRLEKSNVRREGELDLERMHPDLL